MVRRVDAYADMPLRKRDIYKLSTGSVFSRPTSGASSTSPERNHPVYSYARPLFLTLQVRRMNTYLKPFSHAAVPGAVFIGSGEAGLEVPVGGDHFRT